jgi:hypothetical protein
MCWIITKAQGETVKPCPFLPVAASGGSYHCVGVHYPMQNFPVGCTNRVGEETFGELFTVNYKKFTKNSLHNASAPRIKLHI